MEGFYEKIEEIVDTNLEKSPRAKIVWRERDGAKYSALLCDKIAYVWKYHRDALEFWTAVAASVIASVATAAVIAGLG